jgi:hypothetical protein
MKLHRWPTCGGRPVDLYYLYQLVLSQGGFYKFHEKRLWQRYTRAHGVPTTCTSSGTQLAKMYKKYLLAIERKYFGWKKEQHALAKSAAAKGKATSSSSSSSSSSPPAAIPPLPIFTRDVLWHSSYNGMNDGAAALACGFKVNIPTKNEIRTFGHLGTVVFAGAYVEARNHILVQWTSNVKCYLSIERVLQNVSATYHVLLARVYDFLGRPPPIILDIIASLNVPLTYVILFFFKKNIVYFSVMLKKIIFNFFLARNSWSY